ncbi:hypothetical protein AHAS_Ahas19G0225200 [Arachis hypogaea]
MEQSQWDGIDVDTDEVGRTTSTRADGAAPASIHGCSQMTWNPLMGVRECRGKAIIQQKAWVDIEVVTMPVRRNRHEVVRCFEFLSGSRCGKNVLTRAYSQLEGVLKLE